MLLKSMRNGQVQGLPCCAHGLSQWLLVAAKELGSRRLEKVWTRQRQCLVRPVYTGGCTLPMLSLQVSSSCYSIMGRVSSFHFPMKQQSTDSQLFPGSFHRAPVWASATKESTLSVMCEAHFFKGYVTETNVTAYLLRLSM